MERARARAARRAAAVAGLGLVIALVAMGTGATAAPGRGYSISETFSDPAWSPTGNKIAFVDRTTMTDGSGSLSTASIVIANVDGSDFHAVATVEPDRVAWPTWSPDGNRIAFGYDHLYVIRANGTKLREIGSGCCAAWGPGGRRIAFSDGSEVQSQIYVMNADGSAARTVASPSAGHSYWGATWSPRGEKLAFFSDEAPDLSYHVEPALVLLEQYGGSVTRIRFGRFAAPAWSPDGRRIAADGLRVIDLRTGRVRSFHRGRHPSWSPDGRRIAFEDGGRIFIMAADGAHVRQLTR